MNESINQSINQCGRYRAARAAKKQLLTLFEDFITLALVIENSEISMCLLPGLVSWGWIQGQEGDLAADPQQLYVAPDTVELFLTFCLKLNWINV